MITFTYRRYAYSQDTTLVLYPYGAWRGNYCPKCGVVALGNCSAKFQTADGYQSDARTWLKRLEWLSFTCACGWGWLEVCKDYVPPVLTPTYEQLATQEVETLLASV